MKKFLFFVAFVTISVSCFAKIWRVNNNSGISADFTTLQAAHNGAASGDTIYLESSPTSYGALNSSKKLTIIGTGYMLDQNLNLQAFSLPSVVDAITFNTGSAGSFIEGVWTNGSAISIYVNDVVVRRNYLSSRNGATPDWGVGFVYIYSGASNIIISQNFGLMINNNAASTGILILNNFLTHY